MRWKDAAVLLQGEIVFQQDAGDLDEPGIVQQQRTEDKLLGIDIGGEAFLVRRRRKQKTWERNSA